VEAEAVKRKRLNFCGSRSTLKKEAGSGSKLGSDLTLYGAGIGNKNILLLPHPRRQLIIFEDKV